MAFVSVIIPYFKKKTFIERTLLSVLNQTFQDFEIILIYDDEIKEDLKLIKKIAGNNPKIKIIENKKNLGAGLSRNKGIKNSSGSIIAFLDSDDYWVPERLEKQINFMKKNNYKFTFCNYKKKNGKEINIFSKKKKISFRDLLTDCEIGLSTVLLDKSSIFENLFPPLKTKEDFTAWLKITRENIDAYNFPEYLVEWNYSKNSLSSNTLQKIYDGFKVYNIYMKFNYLKSFCYLFLLSFNSIKRKF